MLVVLVFFLILHSVSFPLNDTRWSAFFIVVTLPLPATHREGQRVLSAILPPSSGIPVALLLPLSPAFLCFISLAFESFLNF